MDSGISLTETFIFPSSWNHPLCLSLTLSFRETTPTKNQRTFFWKLMDLVSLEVLFRTVPPIIHRNEARNGPQVFRSQNDKLSDKWKWWQHKKKGKASHSTISTVCKKRSTVINQRHATNGIVYTDEISGKLERHYEIRCGHVINQKRSRRPVFRHLQLHFVFDRIRKSETKKKKLSPKMEPIAIRSCFQEPVKLSYSVSPEGLSSLVSYYDVLTLPRVSWLEKKGK